MTYEIRNKAQSKFDELRSRSRSNDPIVVFLKDYFIRDLTFKNKLRILPLEIVERYGAAIIKDEKEFSKYYDPRHDFFRQEWENHYKDNWVEIIKLIDDYETANYNNITPFEIFNKKLSDQMIKIARRRLLLDPEPKAPKNIVEQKQRRLNGSEKEYKFIRSYWIDNNGEKKRMISRHIGFRFMQLEKEVADLFHNRGFAVHREYRSGEGIVYDMVIERAGMRTVVEINKIDEDTFNDLFLFDELLRRFEQDYSLS